MKDLLSSIVLLEWIIIFGVLALVVWKYFNKHRASSDASILASSPLGGVFTSLFLDLLMVVLLLALSTVLYDPFLDSRLAEVGLRYLSTVILVFGILWFVIGFVRLKVLARHIDSAKSSAISSR
jgi:hypothetical protein